MKIKDAAIAAEELDDALTYYRDVHPDFAETLSPPHFGQTSNSLTGRSQYPSNKSGY